jgi:hypothetical protein
MPHIPSKKYKSQVVCANMPVSTCAPKEIAKEDPVVRKLCREHPNQRYPAT